MCSPADTLLWEDRRYLNAAQTASDLEERVRRLDRRNSGSNFWMS